MKTPLAFSFLLALGASFAPGCDDGDSSSGGTGTGVVTGTPVAQDQLSATLASAICGTIEGCCKSSSFAFDRADCENEIRTELDEGIDEAKKDGLIYNAQNAGNCVATYKSLLSQCKLGLDDDPIDAACDDVFEGTVAEGGDCNGSDQCAGDLYCPQPAEGSSKRVCTRRPAPLAAGANCKQGSDTSYVLLPCSEGLTCDYKTGVCVETPGEGQPCTSECKDGFYCSFDQQSGICKAAGAEGAECDPQGTTSPGSLPRPPCGTNLRCDPESKKCGPQVRPVDADSCKDFNF